MPQKQIEAHQIIDHGVQHGQYFQGCGTAFTAFTAVATGIGSTAREAYEDALAQLDGEWDTTSLRDPKDMSAECFIPDDYSDEHWHRVSVRVR